jgi:fructokinase
MFVVVGEALVDLVGQRGDRTLAAHPGGSPANVALGLARLGVPVTLKTRLGRDAFGEMILAHLEASGVRVDGGPDGGVSTSLAIATLAAGIASYDFRIDWDVEALAPLPIETRCLHTGSLATVLPPGKASVLDLMEREHKRGRVTVSYDPNIRHDRTSSVSSPYPTSSRPATRTFAGSTPTGPVRTSRRAGSPRDPPSSS